MGILDGLVDMQKRWETAQRRMIPGSLGGRTESASPVARVVGGPVVQPWRPGAAGGASFALYSDITGTLANHNNSTTVKFTSLEDEEGAHGITVNVSGVLSGIFTLPYGLYSVAAGLHFVYATGGVREIHVTGTVSIAGLLGPPKLIVPATNDGSAQHLSIGGVGVRSAPGADQLWIFGRQTNTGATALDMTGDFISFLRLA